MFHLAAHFVALANTANTEVPYLNDDVYTPHNSRLVPPEDMQIYAVYSSAVTLLRTRINTPYVRQIAPSFIVPVGTNLLPGADPNVADYRDNPMRLPKDEGLVYESTDSAVGPNNHYILTWLGRALSPVPRGDIISIRGSSTTAVTASTWSTITVTWDTDLKQGWYEVIGGMHISTNSIAFSAIFEGQSMRPGGIGSGAAGTRPWLGQLKGGMGSWGRFRASNMPGIRVLADGADATHVVHLDVVRVGGI